MIQRKIATLAHHCAKTKRTGNGSAMDSDAKFKVLHFLTQLESQLVLQQVTHFRHAITSKLAHNDRMLPLRIRDTRHSDVAIPNGFHWTSKEAKESHPQR